MTKRGYKNGIVEEPNGQLVDDKNAAMRSRNPAQLAYVRNIGILMAMSSVPTQELVAAGISGPYASQSVSSGEQLLDSPTRKLTLKQKQKQI